MSLTRVDLILLQLFPELTRGKVQSLIEKRKIQILNERGEWQTLEKSGDKWNSALLTTAHFKIAEDEELHFVSRGALKIKKAVEEFAVEVQGKICLDVGLSTGGFTDFLLQNGAQRILGIDVGKEQLHPRLRNHPKLVFADKVNAKDPIPSELLNTFFKEQARGFDLIVVDVSFISLTKVIPNLVGLLQPAGSLIVLIKPQFELSKAALNKKGVVRDRSQIPAIIEKIIGVFQQNKLKIRGYCPSPIEGENGNQEILMVADRSESDWNSGSRLSDL